MRLHYLYTCKAPWSWLVISLEGSRFCHQPPHRRACRHRTWQGYSAENYSVMDENQKCTFVEKPELFLAKHEIRRLSSDLRQEPRLLRSVQRRSASHDPLRVFEKHGRAYYSNPPAVDLTPRIAPSTPSGRVRRAKTPGTAGLLVCRARVQHRKSSGYAPRIPARIPSSRLAAQRLLLGYGR